MRLLAGATIHPMLRALWQPRLMEAIRWVEQQERDNRDDGRRPLKAEIKGEAAIDGVTVHGKADRIDRFDEGGVGDHRLQDRQGARAEGGRRGLRAAARPAWA